MEHKSQQTPNFCFSRHQLQKNAGEPERLLGQVTATLVDAGHIIPSNPKSGVNSFEDCVEPLRQLARLRDLELNAGTADLRLGTHQALAHGRRRYQEGVGNAGRIQTKDGLEHQRRVHGRIDCGMGAHEKQFQAVVRELRRRSHRAFLPQELESRLTGDGHLLMPHHIDQRMARRRQQPRFWTLRHAISWPGPERSHQRIAESILRTDHVTRMGAKIGHQATV